ncbi:unannotated protein [freshwater metagenome]|uniref:Unannotated protein n=1 Tax=freshwater metagenome TaxID=449393 RepID=A0A6J6TTT8_9ZZZZ
MPPVLAVMGERLSMKALIRRCGIWSASSALALVVSYSYAQGVYVA